MALDPLALAPDDQVRQLVDDFLAAQISPRTRRSYSTDLAVFLTWLAERDRHPLEVARPDVDRYRNWLSEIVDRDGKPAAHGRPRFAPATVARRLSAIRAFYAYLTEVRVLPGSPAANVRGPRVMREPRGKAISDEQVQKLIDAAARRGAQDEAIIRLLVLNGLRVSEVCGADVEDLRREPGGGHSLRVRGKGGKEVWVALNARTEKAVLAAAGARRQGPLFRRRDGRRVRGGSAAPWIPFNQQAVSKLLLEIATEAGLLGEGDDQVGHLHPHIMRHTFVTMLLDRGVPLAVVQDAARHASADTTRLYDRTRSAHAEHPTHKLDF